MHRSALLLAIVMLAVVLVSDGSRPMAETSSPGIQGFPDEYARYHHGITVPEGETESGYQLGYRLKAINELSIARKTAGALLPWAERGPGNVGGRTRSIVIDANDPSGNTWFAGSVGGGIWRTTDQGVNWTPLTDGLHRLSISSIAQAESDPNILYAGTGEGFPNSDAAIGDGILKSVDGGDTWSVLTSTSGGTDFLFVNRVIVSPQNENLVLAATREGIFRSGDGGETWHKVLEAESFSGFTQIIEEPGDFTNQYAVEERSGVWKSTDAGQTWALSNAGLAEAGGNVRIEMGVSPADPSRLFAVVESGAGADPVYISTDRGETWAPFPQKQGETTIDIAGTQGWYDLMVLPHPFDPDVVFMGGIRMYRLTSEGEQQVRAFSGVDQENTSSFLSFVNFGADHLGGGLRLGTEEEESSILPNQMVSVEVRFGPGRSQFAHRFTPPDEAGVALADYPFRDYIEVPFEVWDITNDRQLHVSFRDRRGDGEFNLIERDEANLGREYVLISARPYDESSPDPEIAVDGGVVTQLAYFFWPMLTTGGTWDPADLPESILRLNFLDVLAQTRNTSLIASGVHVDQHTMEYFPTGNEGEEFQLVAGNDGGVFYSGDGGSNWNGRFRGYNTTQFYGVDKKPGADIYLGGTQDNGSWRSLGSPTAESAWQNAGGGDGFDVIWHKQNPSQVITTSQYTSIRRSLNGGASFSTSLLGLGDTGQDCACAQFITSLSHNRFNSNEVYTLGKTGVWKSRNFAGSWESRPIPIEDWGYNGSGRVHVSNATGSVVWAGYEMDVVAGGSDHAGHLQVSTDQGESFSATTTPDWAPGRVSGISSSFEDSATVYVTFSFFDRAKLIRSRDMGQTWEDLSGFRSGSSGVISDNGFPDVPTYDVIDFPGTPVLWAATEIGLMESLNDGETWHVADNGLPAVSMWQMRLIDEQVVVATHGRGIWSLPLSAVPVDIDLSDDIIPSEFALNSVYPNPLRSTGTLEWTADRAGRASIELFDVQGRSVSTVFEGFVTAGAHQHTLNTESLASGVYFAKIVTESGIRTRSFVRAR